MTAFSRLEHHTFDNNSHSETRFLSALPSAIGSPGDVLHALNSFLQHARGCEAPRALLPMAFGSAMRILKMGHLSVVKSYPRVNLTVFFSARTSHPCPFPGAPIRHHVRFLSQLMITSLSKVRIERDSDLDAVIDKEKALVPLLKIRDVILKFQTDAIPLRHLMIRRRALGFNMPECKFMEYLKDYPTFLELFPHPQEQLPWCRLTPQVISLIQEEADIHIQEEPMIVLRLRKLLMLSRNRRISMKKLVLGRYFFGLPADFAISIVPKYPHYFQIVQDGEPRQVLELVEWDESLAITKFENRAKEEAKKLGLGDLQIRGKPIPFKTHYYSGMKLKKVVIERLESWQRHPYVCPYHGIEEDEIDGPPLERRMIASIHEILSLTIEKKITSEVLDLFQWEFRLPIHLLRTVNRLPGMFYICIKGAVHTVFLREAYNRKRFVGKHPLISLKEKYIDLMNLGPRTRSVMYKTNRQGLNASRLYELRQKPLEDWRAEAKSWMKKLYQY